MVMLLFAFPDSAGRDERHFFTSALGAGHTIRPAEIRQKVDAVIQVGKVADCLSQGLREGCLLFHGYRVPELGGCVKYIIAQTPFGIVSIARNGAIVGGDKLLLAGEEYTVPAGGGLFFHPGDTPIGISVTPESAPVVFTVTEE